MNVTGVTFEAYREPQPGVLSRLRTIGVTSMRAISHNQDTHWLHGKFWKPQSGYLDIVKSLYKTHRMPVLYDTLNHAALPRHKPDSDPTAKDFDDEIFCKWLKSYVHYMAQPGLDYRLVWGNEPDAEGSPYLNDEAEFRRRYALVVHAVRELQSERRGRNIKLSIGAAGYCQDWERGASFCAWADAEGLRLDFVDIHPYGLDGPQRAQAALREIRKASAVPVVMLETGAHWDAVVTAPSADQVQWFEQMSALRGFAAWHIHFVDGPELMSIFDSDGKLTILGEMV